jgi:hypothetical protein
MSKIDTDPDFVFLPRFGYSLTKVLDRYPDGAPDHIIARALGIKEGEVERFYNDAVTKIKEDLDA